MAVYDEMEESGCYWINWFIDKGKYAYHQALYDNFLEKFIFNF